VLFTLLEKDLVGRLEAKLPGNQCTEPFDHRPGHAIVPGLSRRADDGAGKVPSTR